MPNTFDTTSLEVVAAADAGIRITDGVSAPLPPNTAYDIGFIYYRGVNPEATGFQLDWYESILAMSAAPETPGGGNLARNAPSGTPIDQDGSGTPQAGSPLPAQGGDLTGVATGRISGGRTPTEKPEGGAFDANVTYHGRLWILQA